MYERFSGASQRRVRGGIWHVQALCFSVHGPSHQRSCDIINVCSTKKTLKHRRLLAMMHRNCNALGLL
ncbi:hypothetical protein WS7_06540 [Xanthomonas citri pv. malvacearum str. GSPB2388]|uniref:hypothetical protein n=1 Tax=Xanthomonas citri TaxID=346 RepID=UPI0002979AC7|nr:hypothetical protein [Xanthomonas citri]EKQ62043.1 hypothetical protein WS7_06540 [Xanthomonas citri pv. malvacearum str. GSPB2388]